MFGRIAYSGGGTYETAHHPITPSQLASLNSVLVFEDFRDPAYLGVEIDNVRVTMDAAASVPEPSGLVLFLTGVAGLGTVTLVRKRARQR